MDKISNKKTNGNFANTVLADAVFHPILFSTAMVQAILDGRKTQTRRTKGLESKNEFPNLWNRNDNAMTSKNRLWNSRIEANPNPLSISFGFRHNDFPEGDIAYMKSAIKPNDIFWVRETFYKTTAPELNGACYYKATIDDGWNLKWKPSIFMPKEACRIFLKVTEVRVERLQDISVMDAINEGIQKTWISDDEKSTMWKNYINNGKGSYHHPVKSFSSLWESINGKESWDRNPWVWVYDFERIERPLGFC